MCAGVIITIEYTFLNRKREVRCAGYDWPGPKSRRQKSLKNFVGALSPLFSIVTKVVSRVPRPPMPMLFPVWGLGNLRAFLGIFVLQIQHLSLNRLNTQQKRHCGLFFHFRIRFLSSRASLAINHWCVPYSLLDFMRS